MSRGAQLRVSRTKTIPVPNEYIRALYGDFGPWCLDEEEAPKRRGNWRKEFFAVSEGTPLDWEIGTGNGGHFAHHAQHNPERAVLGIELKYKPLIQTIRRAIRAGCKNARMIRYNAALVNELFAEQELDNVYIHFPDPWSKLRTHKHRLLQKEFFLALLKAQKPGSLVEIKTDNRPYFDWALERIAQTPYKVQELSFDLHAEGPSERNFITQFESLFIRQKLPIHRVLLLNPGNSLN